MSQIPPEAIQAAAKVLHAAGCALVSCIQADHPEIWNADKDLAADMLAAAEAVWPHDPPKRSPESAAGGSFTIRHQPDRRPAGFGKDVTA